MTTTLPPPPAPALSRTPRDAVPERSHAGLPPAAQVDSVVLIPALIGALAVLAGSSALAPLVAGSNWLLPLIEVVGVIFLIGVGARLVGLSRWLTVAFQAIAMAVTLTGLFTIGGYGGVIPNGPAIHDAGLLLRQAWEQILSTVPPTPDTTAMSLLIALSVGLAALLVDVLTAAVRAPALVALPLLTLYSVPASISSNMLPWQSFAGPAVLYALLLAAAGQSGRHSGARVGSSLAIRGTMIAAVATAAALLLASMATAIGTEGRLPHSGHSGNNIGLSPFASLHGSLQLRTPVDMVSVAGLDHPEYLRTVALEKWTANQGWSAGPLAADDMNVDGPITNAPDPSGTTARVTVTPLAYQDDFLPIYQRSYSVTGLASQWSYDANLQTIHRTEKIKPAQYQVSSSFPTLTDADLEQDSVSSGNPLTQTGALPAQVVAEARSITASARTPYDAADAMLHYFTDPGNGFSYSLDVPTGNSGSALLDFLVNKKGYCEQYAAAMAIMLDAVGIPARVAIGFTQGIRQPDGSYLIDSNDAHAWVEVLFDRAGWVRFDPTPVVDGQGGQQGFQTTAESGQPDQQTPTASTPAAATPTAQQRPMQSGVDGAQVPGYQQQTPAATAESSSRWLVPTLIAIGALLLLGLVLGTPSLLRSLRRRRRMRLAASGRSGAGAAAWSEIEDTLLDHGIAVRPTDSARITANRLAKTAHLDAAARQDLRSVVIAAEREWYAAPSQSSPSQEPTAAGDLRRGVRTVAGALDRVAPLQLTSRLLPRSLRTGARR